MATIITSQPVSLTAVPGQDSTFTVTASTSILPLSAISYAYQWQLSSVSSVTNILNAKSRSFTIDPLMADNGKTFCVRVSSLSSSVLDSFVISDVFSLTVKEDVPPFDNHDRGTETGRERHRRLHHLGYI
jgi:hypothetical protein